MSGADPNLGLGADYCTFAPDFDCYLAGWPACCALGGCPDQQPDCLTGSVQPTLPFGDINVLVLTDVHSWLGGHKGHDPNLDANYGDVVSFHERLKSFCEKSNKDYWFVTNGDWIDGTGLSMDGDPSHIIPLLEKMPWDILNTGNHELYKSNVVNYMRRPGGFVDWWGERHISSNILISETAEPLSNLYTILEGRHSRVLVFGFLYNMDDPSPEVTVQHVEDAVSSIWFNHAVKREQYDAILVMAHMGTDDPSVPVILKSIRQLVGNKMPVQFINGHTHLRRAGVLDELSSSFEAGRYLDTVGFVSFPNKYTVETISTGSASALFQHEFIDPNRERLKETLGMADDFTTPYGQEVGEFIQNTREELGLEKKLGCSSQAYFLNRSLEEDGSIWRLYREQVVPTQLEQNSPTNRAILLSQNSWRYDLIPDERKLVYDDVIAVSPFDEPVYFLDTFSGSTVLALNDILNDFDETDETPFYNTLPLYIISGTVDPNEDCELYCHHFELNAIAKALHKINPDLVFTPVPTNLTSTTIWTSFVSNQWACPGEKGVSNSWFAGNRSQDKGGADKWNGWKVAVIVIGVVIVLIGVITLCVIITESLCCDSTDYDGELEAFYEESDEEEGEDEVEGEFT